MSKYDWEEGTIKIPVDGYARLRGRVLGAWNVEQESLFKKAERVYAEALKQGFRKRGFDRASWVRENHWEVAHLLTKRDNPKVFKPKKKDLDLKPISRSATLHLGDGATIAFDNKKRTVFWSVSENNHAVETARSHPVARALFGALRHVRWTRGSGGEIYGNDEYNRDNRGFDGGANYVTDRFGPESKNRAFNGMYFDSRAGFVGSGRGRY